ncbi:hypothetical protein GCM10010299_20620 [Streptomyces tanashiensis]|nr:hypothetical protein GCM10010299_20620 [Streptomyces tanashiensis]
MRSDVSCPRGSGRGRPSGVRPARRKTRPTSLPRPKGKQCDEYPLASTTEGGGIIGKTQSRKMIATDHNRQGGTQLATFYNTHRIIPGEVRGGQV